MAINEAIEIAKTWMDDVIYDFTRRTGWASQEEKQIYSAVKEMVSRLESFLIDQELEMERREYDE